MYKDQRSRPEAEAEVRLLVPGPRTVVRGPACTFPGYTLMLPVRHLPSAPAGPPVLLRLPMTPPATGGV